MSLKSEYMLDIHSMSKLVLTEVHWLLKKQIRFSWNFPISHSYLIDHESKIILLLKKLLLRDKIFVNFTHIFKTEPKL